MAALAPIERVLQASPQFGGATATQLPWYAALVRAHDARPPRYRMRPNKLGFGLAGYGFVALDVLGKRLLLAAIATNPGAHRSPCDGTADRCEILTGSAAHLVTENATNDGVGNRPRSGRAASVLDDVPALDPASLLGCVDHCTH